MAVWLYMMRFLLGTIRDFINQTRTIQNSADEGSEDEVEHADDGPHDLMPKQAMDDAQAAPTGLRRRRARATGEPEEADADASEVPDGGAPAAEPSAVTTGVAASPKGVQTGRLDREALDAKARVYRVLLVLFVAAYAWKLYNGLTWFQLVALVFRRVIPSPWTTDFMLLNGTTAQPQLSSLDT
uniref:Uncharacterized protein n=1 Tax=Eutreptiella gymnastica TaxID=73025 RepID=A0A7S1IE36_9EUGL